MLKTIPAPSMTLLFGSFERLQAAIAGGQRSFGRFTAGRFPDGEPLPDDVPDEMPTAFIGPSGLIVTMGIEAQAPGLEAEIHTTRMDNAELASLLEHQAHMLCFQRGEGDGFSLSVELLELAVALAEYDLLGAIHTPGRQCFRTDQIIKIVATMSDEQSHGAIAAMLVNMIPLFAEGCTYYVTRGAQVLGTPEICVFDAENALSIPEVNTLIWNLLPYIQGGAHFEIGQTAEFDGIHMTVEAVDVDYADYIRSSPEDEVIQLRVGGGGGVSGGASGGTDTDLPARGIVAAALLIAAADGKINRKEIFAAIDCIKAKSNLVDVGSYFQAGATNFRTLADTILDEGPRQLLQLIFLSVDEVKEHHGPELALAYGRAIYGMAKSVAEATGGGLFGFGPRIGQKERATLEALGQALGLD